MGWIIPTIKGILVAIGATATLGAAGTGALAAAIGAAVVVGGAMVAKRVMSLFEVEMPTVDTDASRQRTVKSTTEPQKIIYGEALVSGPISFIGLSGTDNSDLYQTIVLAGHEVTEITDIHMDDVVISNADINGGSPAGGAVGSGSVEFGPKNGTICVINKYKGETSQTADPLFTAAFSTGPASNRYTSAHRGDGIAYLAMKWVLNEDSAETWEKFSPSNVKALVKGKPVYDPRLDTGAPNYNPLDQLFITYNATAGSYVGQGQNPALVLADYLISDLGMGISPSKIDWSSFITAANGCDVSVSVPGGTEKRFTCNGVIFATDSHQKNINKILSSMNGNLVYSNGKYIVHAGIYEAPTETLTEDDLIGAISIRTSLERSDRFNTIKGLFIDPAQNHKSSEFPKVQLADAVTRDNNEILEKEVQYPMTNSSYMAQRLSNKLIQLSDQQKVVSFPANLSALRITAGDRVQVSVEELNWSNKVFQCAGWTFSEDGGVNLTLREDSSTSYADPAVNEYSTVTATGDITDAFRGVPSPSGLSATAGLKSNELNWVNPGKPNDFSTIYVYASPNGNFSSAVKIGETDGTQFIHDASNSADSVVSGDVRYYWVRAVRNVGTDAASRSNLEPNADPNTTVFATVGRVNWADVAGSTNAPADNATVGAQLSVNLYDVNGTTVLGDVDVKNSILAQEILEVEVESGEVLNLETGQDVDIQNLGDVAIYVSNSNQTLNTSINTVANNLSALETVVVDLTSGVSEVFIQATAPVAGVGGIPDPIPDFSRWYDSSNNNQPYYWDGSAWQDLRDGQTTQNAAAITNLQTSLTTTNSNVTTNASAISVLDATTVTQGSSITSITSDVTALETTVNDATTGVAATSTALGNLTTRVTTAEGSITTNASDITTLQTDVTTAESNITTNASAISGLDTRVTTAEGSIVSQASDITALETTVNNDTTGVAANASGLTALTTRVTNTEGATTVNASAVTTLNATYTEDLHFRTQAEDESDNLIDLETSGTVELQDLTDFVAGSSAAIDSLTVQTFANENGIQTQAIQLTALESTVNDPTNGVVATAGALSNLSTTVSVIDGKVTSTAQDLTTLTTTVGENTASITTQATSIDGVEANYSVKIDNNNRITGFGLLSTTSGATPFSEFAVVADQFSIVSPDSTADTPIQPFTVTADKIYFGADVIVSGDLISTGTISADRLQIDGVMFDTETVGGVTSLIIKESGINTSQIAESAITTARLSNDAVTVDKFANTLQSTNYVADTSGWQILTSGDVEFQNAKVTGEINATSGTLSSSIAIGTGNSIFKADSNGIYLGNATFASAPFRVSQAGALTASSATLTGNVTASSFTLAQGATLTDLDGAVANAQQIMSEVTGIIDANQHAIPSFWRITTDDALAPSNTEFNAVAGRLPKINDIVITTDTTTTPDTTYGWTCSVAGVADPATEATWVAITNFISGDLLVDGSVSADQINANSVASAVITAGSIVVENDLSDGTTTISGDNILTGTILASYIDVSGVISAGALITDSATINNDIKIGSGESVFKADSNGIYLGSETFASAEFRVTPSGVLTATGANISGAITATSLSLSEGITIAKSVVGLTNVDDVSQATIQSDTLTAATSSDVGLGSVENLDAQNQAQTGLIAGTTITGGGITMSAGGAIKTTGKDSESDTTNGFFLGYNGTNYTFGVGDANQSMQWTGSALNIVGALNATSLNVTNITGAVTGFDAGKISGDVTEVYPLSSTPNVSFDNSGTPNPTVMASFSIPAPENAVSKRHRLSLAFEIQSRRSSGTGLDAHTIWYWASRKSLGFEAVAIGDVTLLSTPVSGYVEVYTISGNVTDQMDNNGAIAPNTNPSAAQIGKIIGVSYQAATNKTNIEVSFGSGSSPHYANGTTMYFSPSQFTSSGVYPDSAWQGKQSLILDGTSITYATVPLIASFGSTTVARDYRIYAQNSAQYTNLTVTCPKLYGTVENIA